MDFEAFKSLYRRKVVFEYEDIRTTTGMKPASLRVQLSRWCDAGRLSRLRKGLYAFGPRDRVLPVRGPVVANLMVQPSYLTALWALEFHGIVSEHGDVDEGHWRGEPLDTYTCAAPVGRTYDYENEFGSFRYYKLKPQLMFGAEKTRVGRDWVWVATPEKALLDYFYVTPRDWGARRILERGFHRLNGVDLEMMRHMAVRYRSPRLAEIVGRWRMLARRERLFAARWLTPPPSAEQAVAEREAPEFDPRYELMTTLQGQTPERLEPAPESVPQLPEFALEKLSSEEFIIGGEARVLMGRPLANTIGGNWGRSSGKKQWSWELMSDEPAVCAYDLPAWFTQRLWYHRDLKGMHTRRCKQRKQRPRWHRMKEWARETRRHRRRDRSWIPEKDDFLDYGLEYRFFPPDWERTADA